MRPHVSNVPGADIRVVSHTGTVGPVADLGENWKVPEMFPDVLVSRYRATHGASRLGSFIDGHPAKQGKAGASLANFGFSRLALGIC